MTASQVNSFKMPIIIFGQILLILSVFYSVFIPLFLVKKKSTCWQYVQPEIKMDTGWTISNHLASCGKSKTKQNKKSPVCEAMDQKSAISNL